jgi:malate dehydrogenase
VVLPSFRFTARLSPRSTWMVKLWRVLSTVGFSCLARPEMTLLTIPTGVQFGGDEIVKSKQGAGSATTCMAYAGFRFIKALLASMDGEAITEEAYVYLPGIPGGKEIAAELGVNYFAVKIELGKTGATKALPIGKISEHETRLLEVALKELKTNIATGLSFMA